MRRLLVLALLAGSLVLIGRGWLLPRLSQPQLILVLGGDIEREKLAGRLAHRDGLPLLVSGGSNPEYAQWLFSQEGLDRRQFRLDYRARDTLGNFTTVVDDLKRLGIQHVLLVTSNDHMDRALLVGRIVAGSRGIHLTPVAVPCGKHCLPEGRRKVWGDGLRAAAWVVTGRDLRSWAAGRIVPALGPAAPGQGAR
ncbi:YdcF family protein [Synechococcus sp. 1G10]|uniref:YdcF family protein n=1 Tax=Synechococcus sp. 1G10 TaxID=2025605 RepID=UPI000B992310|nr:YdcF family protein [Synechococcus sp. 1G10]